MIRRQRFAHVMLACSLMIGLTACGSDGSGDEAPVACSCYAGRGADEQPPVLIPLSIDPQQTAGTGDAWLPTPGSRCWGMEMEPPAAKDRPRRPPDPPPRPAY